MPHPRPVWLDQIRDEKRTLKDIKRYEGLAQIYDRIVNGDPWEYKINKEFYRLRDTALLVLIYLTGGRINEVLRLRKDQFDFDDPEFVIIRDFEISKRKAKTIKAEGIPKIDMPLPRMGEYEPFIDLIMDYYKIAPELLFNIGRKRAWAIVEKQTGKWCHYFRCQRLSHTVNQLKSALITAKIYGVKNPQTIAHYYKTEWEEHREKLKK